MRSARGGAELTLFAFYGTFMRGQPGHGNLAGARFVEEVVTAPRYRLYHVDARWPALVPSDGVQVACELYDVPEDLLARLAELEPPGWHRAPVELADSRVVEAFLGQGKLGGVDISRHGSWAAFVAATGAGAAPRDGAAHRDPP